MRKKRLVHEAIVEIGIPADVEKLPETLSMSILLHQISKCTLQIRRSYRRLPDHLLDPWKRAVGFLPDIGDNCVLNVFPYVFLRFV